MRIPFLLLFCFSLSTIWSQTMVVKARSYLDVTSGLLAAPAVVLIKDGLIEAINPPSIPADAIEVNLEDQTLLPGLIDMHTHLTLDLEDMGMALRETAADWALRGAKNAKITLMAGFTTVRDVGSNGFSDVALSKAINKGYVEGPDIFPSAHAIGITGGHMDRTGFAPGVAEEDYRSGVADGPNDLMKATRYQIKHGAKVIKIGATAGVLSFEGPVGAQQLTQAEMEAVVEEANRHGIRVAAHSHGKEGMLAAVRAGIHSVEHGSMIDDEVIAAMKENGTYLVPTTYIPYGINWDKLPPIMVKKGKTVSSVTEVNIAKAIKAGVKLAFGTDAGVYPHGDNAKEFSILVKLGLSPLEAIRGATIYATDLLGVADRGVIAVGKKADIIGLNGNPLEDVTLLEKVAFVMKSGKVVKR